MSVSVARATLAAGSRAALERARSAAYPLGQFARRARLLPYRTERWSVEEWQSAYRTGRLDYFESLPELARYSVLAGYLVTFGAGRAILDIGCGRGILRERLRDLEFRTYTGIDLSGEAIRAASVLTDARTSFFCGDVGEIDLPAADIAVLSEVLYYARDPSAMLDAIDGAVAPGGLILTSMWRHPGDQALWRLLDRRYGLVDVTDVRNRANTLARRGWRVACHRLR